MDPYRSDHSARSAGEDTPRDQGIVGDIIAQFADPLAFYRELVQNAIDAGSPSVEIKLEYDPSANVLRVAVRDRGEGMTRDILENQLLVLFRSTKEKDDTKIGKFGIGFTSVLAPNPEVVVVQTSRDERRLTLHLHRDLTYQLFDAGPATQTGTTVELDLAMHADEVEKFARSSIEALTRWCRHAAVPVTFSARLPDSTEVIEAQIDRPLGIDQALVEVTRRSEDGKCTAVVGLLPGAAPYLGFFNHGLMLHETTEALLGKVAVKLQDGRLGHTLSRDDVRRDASLDRALAFARDVIAKQLPGAASVALRAAADSDRERWWQLATAICDAKVELDRSAWWFPMLWSSGQALAIDANGLGRTAWVAAEKSSIVAQLIARGDHVLEAQVGERPFLKALVKEIAGCELRDVESELTSITPVQLDDHDTAMIAIINELAAAVHRAPRGITLARFEGLHADAFAIACDRHDVQVVDRDMAAKNPFGRRTHRLALSVDHAWFRGAREHDPRAGASLLLRQLLLQHELLDVPRSTSLLELELDRIGLAT
ncbi:MAG: ATP-binding protein [Deltaproteobacteria bacterium]|nr:ATP-binding protein [Deltaproteobacteria bacterium]